MTAPGRTLWTISCLTVITWMIASSSLFAQPDPQRSEPNILRVVLRMNFSDEGGASDVRILSTSRSRGVLRNAPLERLSRVQLREIHTGSAALVRYTLEGGIVVDSGHFLLGRRAHAEVLDSRRRGLVRRFEGRMSEVVARVPIPLNLQAEKLTIGIVDNASLEGIEDLDEAGVSSTASADLPQASAAGLEMSSLIASHMVGKELIHPSGGVANPGGFNIVFLGDGFTDASLWLYQREVEAIKKEMIENTYPLSALKHALNIWRVDLVTTEDWTADNLPDEGVDVAVIEIDDQSGEESSCTEFVPPVDRPNVLGTHFCGELSEETGPIYRILGTDDWSAIYAFADEATQYYDDYIIVLAHSADQGGAGYWPSDAPGSEVAGPVAFASVASARGCAPEVLPGSTGTASDGSSDQDCGLPLQGWDRPRWRSVIHSTAVHEFGHAAFELGDEYCNAVEFEQSWYCEPSEDYSGAEPWHANVTKARTLAELASAGKWAKLVVPTELTALPRRVPGCASFECPQQCGCCLCPDECECPADCDCPDTGCPARVVPPLASDLAGLFEGATFGALEYGCGLFRPRHECKMNWDTEIPFCPVCRDAVLKAVAPYVGAQVYVQLDSLTVANFEAAPEEVQGRSLGLPDRALRSAGISGIDYKFQVAAGWVSPVSTQAQGSAVPPTVELGDFQPIPDVQRYGSDLFLNFERRLAVLHPPLSIPSPRIRVSYRVLTPDDLQLTSGWFNLEPETGVHITVLPVAERPNAHLRFTISVVSSDY